MTTLGEHVETISDIGGYVTLYSIGDGWWNIVGDWRPFRFSSEDIELREKRESGWLVNIEAARCRCGHEWVPHTSGYRPQRCPKCKSRSWWK